MYLEDMLFLKKKLLFDKIRIGCECLFVCVDFLWEKDSG